MAVLSNRKLKIFPPRTTQTKIKDREK